MFVAGDRLLSCCLTNAHFDYVIIETVGTGQEAMPFQSKLIDQTVLVMNPDYGARLQLQKIVMLDRADIVVVNEDDLGRAKAALNEIEYRLTQNGREAENSFDGGEASSRPGSGQIYEMITRRGTKIRCESAGARQRAKK